MIAHAKLSASGSARWLNCPGSVKATSSIPNDSSSYALEGTLAHAVADECLKRECDADFFEGKHIKTVITDKQERKDIMDQVDTHIRKDMCRHVQEYIDYVRSFETEDSILFTEERVDFSHVVPEGFGTLDSSVLIPDDVLHIFDLKYGKGVLVEAFDNSQGKMYGIGMINEVHWLHDFKEVCVHICQPRKDSFTSWTISVKDLLKFADWVQERAQLALSDDAPRIAGHKQCEWCRAAKSCDALKKFNEQMIGAEFDDLDDESCELDSQTITDDDRTRILNSKDLIIKFLNEVEKDVYKRLMDGQDFEGFKLIAGRSNRKFTDNAEKFLVKKLGKKGAYKTSLIGIGEAEKQLGKEDMSKITYKPTPQPSLAKASDPKPAIKMVAIEDEFDDLEDL